MKLRFCSIIFFIFSTCQLFRAQAVNPNQPITINQGLSQNLIYSIFQSSDGFIWFGTKDGLNRYDGYEIQIYRNDPDEINSLSNNEIRAITEDINGNLWVGTYGGGLNKFNPTNGNFTTYRFKEHDNKTISSDFITDLNFAVEDEPVIWISTINGFNRYRIDSNYNERFYPSVFNIDENSNNVRALEKDKDDRIWLGIMNGGLYYFNYNTKQLIKPIYDKGVIPTNITCVTTDKSGKMFAGNHNAILFYDDKTNSLHKLKGSEENYLVVKSILAFKDNIYFSNFNTPGILFQYNLNNDSLSVFSDNTSIFEGTNSGRIITLLNDSSDNLWIGTNGHGTLKKNMRSKKYENFLFQTNDKKELSFSSVNAIHEDHSGNIWIAGYGGLDKLDKKTGEISPAKFLSAGNRDNPNLPFLGLYAIIDSPLENDALWISDRVNGLINYNFKTKKYSVIPGSIKNSGDSFAGMQVYDMKYDNQGNLWIATEIGLSKYKRDSKTFECFNKEAIKNFPEIKISAIIIDSTNNIWIGTEGNGVLNFDPIEKKIINYYYEPTNNNSLSSNKILSLLKDKKGNLWIGTNGSGLNKLVIEKNRFTRYTTNSGLPNNVIYGILEDENGFIWMSTNLGLSKFDPANGSFRNYEFSDGLQSNEFNNGAYYKSSDGTFYFGGIKGVTSFKPENITVSEFNPNIVITKFEVNNEQAPLAEYLDKSLKLILSYKENIFSFQFSSLDFTNPLKNKYSYRLKGFNDEWTFASADHRHAAFTNIDPGEYLFELKGTNSDGIYSSKTFSLPIIIVPPYWNTLWFKSLIVLMIISITVLLYRRKINALKYQHEQRQKFSQQLLESQEKERKRIAKELHDAVGQDLLIIKNLAELARRKTVNTESSYLEDISGKSQKAIDDIRQISRNLRPYLIERLGLTKAIEAIVNDLDVSSEITFHFHSQNIDGKFSDASEIQIYRIIQELLNNIIKHSKASEAVITIVSKPDSIFITIKDDGIGIMTKGSEETLKHKFGFGLTGIMERVRILKGKIDIKSLPGKGTGVFINLPYDK